jgi:hypothetical protein
MEQQLSELAINPVNAAAATTKYREYMTHDNGGRPYTVELEIRDKKTSEFSFCRADVSIFRNVYIRQFNEHRPKGDAILEYTDAKVWVGISPSTPATRFSGGYGPDFKGNSILIQPDESVQTYIFVGREVLEFNAYHPIHTFVAPVGNSDVPYCYAIDEAGLYYLLVERAILSRCQAYDTDPNEFDPYDYYYYDHHGLFPGKIEDIWYVEEGDTSDNGRPRKFRVNPNGWRDHQADKHKYVFWRVSKDKSTKYPVQLAEVDAIVAKSEEEKGTGMLFEHKILHKRAFLSE